MSLRITPAQIQKQVLSPYMQQSIQVLLMPIMDLTTAVHQELETNPLLEINEETGEENTDGQEDNLHQPEYIIDEEMDIPYRHDDQRNSASSGEIPAKYNENLEEDLLRQLRIETTDLLKLEIGALIIGDLDEDGYLKITCEEIAETLRLPDLHVVEEVLKTVQGSEPVGIASRNLKECLLKQIQAKGGIRRGVLSRIVEECLPELGQKKYREISRKLSLPIPIVREAAQAIAGLDPRPARNQRPIHPHVYIKPDVVISTYDANAYQALLNDQEIPALRVNSHYKSMLKSTALTPQEKEFIKEKLKNAIYFIRSVRQRGQTIKEIARVIAEKQKDFLVKGHMALVPMSLKDVARELNRNESTISRAISNKYIQTPKGLFPMKFFFSQSVGNKGSTAGGGISNRSVKEEIKRLIDEEDRTSPLTDQEIQHYFSQKGMKIARRTISKYRQALNILPTYLRKE